MLIHWPRAVIRLLRTLMLPCCTSRRLPNRHDPGGILAAQQETSQTPEASPPTQAQPRAESAKPPALTVNNAGNRPNLDRVPDYRALRDFALRK